MGRWTGVGFRFGFPRLSLRLTRGVTVALSSRFALPGDVIWSDRCASLGETWAVQRLVASRTLGDVFSVTGGARHHWGANAVPRFVGGPVERHGAPRGEGLTN